MLAQAMEESPDDARLYNNMGVIARERGDYVPARELFNRAIELAPEWELPRQNLESLPES
ncbi:MAG: tetratricopeptide repeat protein [Anaerolineales bacterium]